MSNPIFFMYRLYWRFAQRKRSIVAHTLLAFIANLFDFFPALIVARVLNIIQTQGLNEFTLKPILALLVLYIFLEVAFWSFHAPGRVIERASAFMASANYKEHLINGIMNLPAAWHTNQHSGDLIDKVEKGSYALREFAGHTFEVVMASVRLVSSYIVLTYFNPAAGFIALFFIVATLTFIVQADKRIAVRLKQHNKFQNAISAKVFDTISNITTIITLRIERLVSASISKKLFKPYSYENRTNRMEEWKWFAVSMSIVVMLFTIMLTYFTNAINTDVVVLVGTVSVLFTYSIRIGDVFYNFAYRYGDIVKWRAAVANAEDVSVSFASRKKVSQVSLKDFDELVIDNLAFAYEDVKHRKKLHLDGVSMRLLRNQRIALIGPSGSGKTTALKLIREIYPPKSVELSLDGKPLADGFAAISEHISLIPQDPELFSTTIRENITLGLLRSDADIKRYTDLARFSDVVKRLPNGLESSIVEKGVNLSGGEKQRLALARGLLFSQDKDILLLDEPTSSVDAKNELAIYEDIFRIFKDKVILSSIHRLHLLPLFDYIYYFKDGKIVAEGTYDSLKRSSKEFKDLLKKYQKATKRKK